jgi:hypothetical protein
MINELRIGKDVGRSGNGLIRRRIGIWCKVLTKTTNELIIAGLRPICRSGPSKIGGRSAENLTVALKFVFIFEKKM